MAKKHAFTAYLTPLETIAGGILFLLYLLVLPFAANLLFNGAERLLGTSIDAAARAQICYYALFILVLVIFYQFIGRTTGLFLGAPGRTLATAWTGLVLFYGLSHLVRRLLLVIFGTAGPDMSWQPISAQIDSVPRTTVLILVLISPFIEEVLFRGYVFGWLRGRNRWAAYGISCFLYAFLYFWNMIPGGFSLESLALALQVAIPGGVLAWAYDRSGTLWAPLLIHITANALAIWT